MLKLNNIKFVNMTSHDVNDVMSGTTIKKIKGTKEARATISTIKVMEANGISIVKTIVKDVNLPDPIDNTIFIVSGLCLSAMIESNIVRSDIVSPGQVERDKTGKIVGCQGFRINA